MWPVAAVGRQDSRPEVVEPLSAEASGMVENVNKLEAAFLAGRKEAMAEPRETIPEGGRNSCAWCSLRKRLRILESAE